MKLRLGYAFLSLSFCWGLSGCSGYGSSSSSSSSSLKLSGSLSTSLMRQKAGENADMAVSLSDLEVYAIAFTTPPVAASGAVDAGTGAFSVDLPGANGAPVTAVFRDKTDHSQVGSIVFTDAASKDLDGNDSESSSVSLKGSTALGPITLGSDGKVTVPVATIASTIGDASTLSSSIAFDPTGTWYMKAFDGTLPSGYETVGSSCADGPCIDFPVTMIRFLGHGFTPGGACTSDTACASGAGATDANDRYGLSIWGDTAVNGVGGCGYMTGFTADEARFHAHINIASLPTIPLVSGAQMNFGPYVYTQPAGFGGDAPPFDKFWMKTGATLTRDLADCQPTTISGTYKGWACRAKVMHGAWPGAQVGTNVGWNVGVEGGGCFNGSTGKPVNVTNWSVLGVGTCTPVSASGTYGAGYYTNTCNFTGVDHDGNPATPAINVQCSNTFGQFTDLAGAPTATPLIVSSGDYLSQPTPVAVSGASCSSIGHADDAHTLAAYRCYAEAFWGATGATAGNCAREYRFNWSATNPADFARDSDRGKPKSAFITNILKYNPDGTIATLEDEQKDVITVSTGASTSTFCEISKRTVMTIKKISTTRLLMDLRMSGQMNSTTAACLGVAKDALAGKQIDGGGDLEHTLTGQKMIFYLDSTL